jgi:hypothetical protein
MALTGRADGPPLSPPPGLVRGLDELAAAVRRWSAEVGTAVEVDWAELLTVRARALGLRRRGRHSAGGTCRLLGGRQGWIAVNLPRPEDRAAVAAVVEGDAGADPWVALEEEIARRPVTEVVGRARLLGVPAAPLAGWGQRPEPTTQATGRGWSSERRWAGAGPRALADLRIVDLSSMWAGPLAAAVVGRGGARVVKVESTRRPDGARAVPALYRSLHPDDQEVVRLDLLVPEGRRRLRALLAGADVVIESSRPRALEQLGAGPDDVGGRAGRVWASITGYGRAAPGRDWVAFGDDAAVAGGLVSWEDEHHPVFCGDALADPVTGLAAAAAVLESVATGGGVVLDISMQACAAALVAGSPAEVSTPAQWSGGRWQVVVEGAPVPVRVPADEARIGPGPAAR